MKKFLALFIVAVLALSLVACGTATPAPVKDNTPDNATVDNPPAASGSDIQVGIVLPTKDEPRWLQDEKSFADALTSAGFTYEVLFSAGSPATEKANVDSLITKGIKVLIICPHDSGAAAATAQAARDAGVKVISYDRLITGTDAVDYYVTFDSFAVGAAQGQFLVDNASGTANNLYLFAGDAGDNNAFIFFEGAWSVLQPKIADGTFVIQNSSEAVALKGSATMSRADGAEKIIAQITTQWNFDVAKKLAETMLAANNADQKGVCFALAPNDGTGRAIFDAFDADNDVTKVFVTGQDAEQASIQYVIDGKQSMSVFKDTRVLAKDAVAIAAALLGGNAPATTGEYDNQAIKVPAKQTAIVVITKDNVQKELIDSGAFQAGDFTGL